MIVSEHFKSNNTIGESGDDDDDRDDYDSDHDGDDDIVKDGEKGSTLFLQWCLLIMIIVTMMINDESYRLRQRFISNLICLFKI